jgi:D-glycero-D-manno-heptose 1,7-bisphosphate phosphatase
MADYPTYRVVLLDRDGVINDNPNDYITRWSDFVWLPGALEALRSLHEQGVAVAIVTNQGCIARGLCTAADVDLVHERMLQAVEDAGGHISAIYSCPHYHQGCDCEKPAPGNALRAMRDLGVSPEETCFVGDRLVDMQAAWAAGIDGYMLRSGYWADWPTIMQSDTPPVATFDDLAQFVDEVVTAPVAAVP